MQKAIHVFWRERERERERERDTPIISLDLITNVINFHSNYKRKLSSHVIITESKKNNIKYTMI
jgi:hypothetical protein